MFVHIHYGFEERLEIALTELCFFRKVCADETAHLVQPICNELLSAYGAQLISGRAFFLRTVVLSCLCKLLIFEFFRSRHACDADILGVDGVDAACKRHLHRPADLSGVWAGGQYAALR